MLQSVGFAVPNESFSHQRKSDDPNAFELPGHGMADVGAYMDYQHATVGSVMGGKIMQAASSQPDFHSSRTG